MQNYQLLEKLAHQNRERIAERAVHAKGVLMVRLPLPRTLRERHAQDCTQAAGKNQRPWGLLPLRR
jgi:catalase